MRLREKKLRYRSINWDSLGPRFTHLQKLILQADTNEIKLTFFINPYHISYLQLLNDLGYWADFLKWKISLSNFIKSQKLNNISAYDFSEIGEITSEPVMFEKPRQPMKWFWEPSHYTSSLGDVVIPILMNNIEEPKFGKNLITYDIDTLTNNDINRLQKNKQQWEELKNNLNLTIY